MLPSCAGEITEEMGLNLHTACLSVLWTSHLFLLTAGYSTVNPRIILTAPQGEKRFHLDKNESLTTLYLQKPSSLLVGAEGTLYSFDFERASRNTKLFPAKNSDACQKPEEKKNYLTFIGKYEDKLLVCGTNACNPTCWNGPDWNESSPARGLAPFVPNQNSLVLVDSLDIYSTINLHLHNGKIPRFRQVRGQKGLYTSDTVMQNPQFVKATVIKQDEIYDDKIYYFFREDNPDKSLEAPSNVSRVAQLCKGDKGGQGSLSASKWTTFLKAMLVCIDPATKGNFDWLQDVFIVPSEKGWKETKAYGLFSNSWGFSAVCVYSFGDIDAVFRTSKLKGYTANMPHIRPGQCHRQNHTPPETFKIADSYPEVEERVRPVAPRHSPLFHNKNRYQKIGVHRIEARDRNTYNVLYLVTDKGHIHKMVETPHGVLNILEIQPFEKPAPILAMTLDHEQAKLYVSSASEVVQLPMDMCEVYRNSCESCILAKDPYCGWADGECVSVKANLTMIQNMTLDVSPEICRPEGFRQTEVDSPKSFRNVTVEPFSRYYLDCPTKSHAATYEWRHNGSHKQVCSSAHRPCLLLLENVTHELYGRYTCISTESGFTHTIVREWLLKRPEPSHTLMQKSQAEATSLSFWLGFLQMVALVLLFQ